MIRIFVIDDDPILGGIIKKTVEKIEQSEVHHFLTPEDCLSNLHLNPDIVTIDYLLPGMNGMELMDKIKNYNEGIQCIIVSGQEKVDVVVEAYRHGAADYIIKNENASANIEFAVQKLCANAFLKREIESLKDQIIDRNKYTNILGNSAAILKILKLIQKVEKSNIMVLITRA
jgi:DNA-binding NtrC family response regulator